MKCVLGCVFHFHINLKSRLNRDMEEKGIVAVCRLPELLPDSGAGVRQELSSFRSLNFKLMPDTSDRVGQLSIIVAVAHGINSLSKLVQQKR